MTTKNADTLKRELQDLQRAILNSRVDTGWPPPAE